jgi:hypothetical protein
MSKIYSSSKINSNFNLKEYVEASTDAASRTRIVTIILVVATVLVGLGYYNSLESSWPHYRVRHAFDFSEANLEKQKALIGVHPDPNGDIPSADQKKIEDYQRRTQEIALKEYYDHVLVVTAPFFGISFDVNDLGLVGGLALIIILLLMRYSLSREIKNLNLSFREATEHDQLCEFYHSLAMRQVLTVPERKGEDQNRWLANFPKYLCILPAAIFTLGVGYDYISVFTLKLFSLKEVLFQFPLETLWLALIWHLSLKGYERQRHINSIWEQQWKRIENKMSSVIRLDGDLVVAFGNDQKANMALRKLLEESPFQKPEIAQI